MNLASRLTSLNVLFLLFSKHLSLPFLNSLREPLQCLLSYSKLILLWCCIKLRMQWCIVKKFTLQETGKVSLEQSPDKIKARLEQKPALSSWPGICTSLTCCYWRHLAPENYYKLQKILQPNCKYIKTRPGVDKVKPKEWCSLIDCILTKEHC